ncbi:MAG: sialate O-acetylesterase [Pedobacter sp.]|nr:MAG: sialate O-acetylesterase [Pedobacter sp.]
MVSIRLGCAYVLFCLGFAASGYGQVKLPDVISSHMVLKQKSAVPLWGLENPDQKLRVFTGWDQKSYQTIADKNGRWQILVNTPVAGGPYKITFSGKDTVQITDVLIGEVWISSGQSNMAFRLRQDSQAKIKLPQAGNSQIRLYKPARVIADKEAESFSSKQTKWEVSSPQTAAEFSAMTYYFAAEMQRKLKVPIGVINVSWGGVSIESWLPKSSLETSPILQNSVVRWKKWAKDYEVDSLNYINRKAKYAITKTGDKPELPQSMYMIRRPHRKHSVLYNGMTAPLTPFALSGLLWYQGTSSVAWAEEYELQLKALIKSWRAAFKQPDLPVIVGQLTAYKYEDEAKAYQLRDAQLRQKSLKNVNVVCNMDLGELDNVHPTNKEPYGLRFASMALNQVYGKKSIAAFCPTFKAIRAEGNQLFISFEHAKGLHIKGGSLDEVYIAGSNKHFMKAEGTVINEELVVHHKAIKHPQYVRYLYYNTTKIPLYNEDKLPAFPFASEVNVIR